MVSITCINNGKSNPLQSIDKRVSIRTMMIIFLVMLVNSILGIVSYNFMKDDMKNLCDEFGYNLDNNDEQSVSTILIILITLCLILFVMIMGHFISINAKFKEIGFNFIAPGILLIVIIVCSIILSIQSDNNDNNDNTNDGNINILKWCSEKKSISDSLYGSLIGFLVFDVLIIISYLSSLFKSNRSSLKNIEQKLTIGNIFIIFLVTIITSIISLINYSVMKDDMKKLCNEFNYETFNYESKIVEFVFIILITICSILFIMILTYYFQVKGIFKINNLIVPAILLGVIIASSIILGLTNDDNIDKIENPKIAKWCTEKKSKSDNILYAISIILGIIISFFIGYMAYIVQTTCQIG